MNTAVERFFAQVNPVLRDALVLAIQSHQCINVDRLPLSLLPPAFLLATVAAEWTGAPLVDRYAALAERVRSLYGRHWETLPNPNCEVGECHVRHLPAGTAFVMAVAPAYASKRGVVLEHTQARTIVEWDGTPSESTFTDKEGHAHAVTFNGRKRASVALETAVVPEINGFVYRGEELSGYPESELTQQVYKELTGVFVEEKKGRRR